MVDQNRVVFNDRSMVLTAPPLEGATVRFDKKQRPQFKLGLKDNEITVTVFTNLENDANKGRIDGKLSSSEFYAAMHHMRKLAEGKTTSALTIEIKEDPDDPKERARRAAARKKQKEAEANASNKSKLPVK